MGSHIALFFGKEKTGSFYLHRKDSEELPSGGKKQKIFQKRKGFNSPHYCWFARANFVLWQRASDDVALRDCPQPKLLHDHGSFAHCHRAGARRAATRFPTPCHPRTQAWASGVAAAAWSSSCHAAPCPHRRCGSASHRARQLPGPCSDTALQCTPAMPAPIPASHQSYPWPRHTATGQHRAWKSLYVFLSPWFFLPKMFQMRDAGCIKAIL